VTQSLSTSENVLGVQQRPWKCHCREKNLLEIAILTQIQQTGASNVRGCLAKVAVCWGHPNDGM